jgi:hypothetical protein
MSLQCGRTLLARKELTVGTETLPRGQMLIMGGDEVYPKASEQAYSNQLRQPYRWAFPDHDQHADQGVPVFAIPGNHDWYDGLDLFLAHFCREKHWHLGSWRSQQRRSYFALQLTDVWWLWATDIQLAETMDQPQAEYFASIAAHMPSKAKIILCSAEPGWLYTDTNIKSWDIMDFALGIASEARNADGTSKELKVPILLSGDTHHYSRYEAKDGVQFVTSGGGGAFLHPTHHLEQNITVEWLGLKKSLQLGKIPTAKPGGTPSPACYPSKETCQTLVWQNLFFALKNWDFSLLMGAIYWLGGIAIAFRDQWDVYVGIAVVFGWAIIGYTKNQEKPKGWKKALPVFISSAVHAGCHIAAVILFARYFASWNEAHPLLPGHW